MRNNNDFKTEYILENFLNGFFGGQILDVGCNECIIAERLNFYKDKYTGIEIDKDAIKVAKSKGFVVKEVDLSKEKLPFNHYHFDSFLALDILEHLIDPKETIKEIKRVTRKGGKGVIALPNDLNLVNIMKVLLLNRSIVTRETLFSPIGHLHFPNVKESINLISSEFKILKIHFVPSNYTVPILPNKLKYLLCKISKRFFCQTIIFEVENV